MRLDMSEFVEGMIFAETSVSSPSVGLTLFSTQIFELVEEAMKILNTPRTLVQNRSHRVRK